MSVRKYGKVFMDGTLPIHIELMAFRYGFTPEKGGLGKYQHLLNIIQAFWPYHPKTHKQGFQMHPWAELMLEEACRNQYLGISGPKSSAKTETFAVWGLVNWLCAPTETLVLMTSTTMKEARKRIWGAMRERYIQCPFQPGKLVDSMGIIRLDGEEASDRASISLIPSSPEREKEATAKLIGLKQKRVFLIGDEMTDISSSVVEACHNLDSNPEFQMVALGNFKSLYDPFGVFITPKHGWASVSVDDERWQTTRGLCLHLDGFKTPNIYSDPTDKWPFLFRKKALDESLARGEENTISFWRFIRSFPSPTGAADAIYAESEFRKFEVDLPVVWQTQPVPVCGLDPGFTNLGDRTVAYFGFYGQEAGGKWVIQWHHFEILNEDVTLEQESRSFQIARQLAAKCSALGIIANHVGVDATGAGDPLCDVIDSAFNGRVHRVKFGEKPTASRVSRDNPLKCTELYSNRVTELWYVGVEFLRSGQLRGICPELGRELTSRLYGFGNGKKILVESKKEMKLRMGRSPDIADAAFIMLDVCRQVLGAMAGGVGSRTDRGVAWRETLKRLDVYAPQELMSQGGPGRPDQ
ncbi:MAG: hypothetical protein ABI162_06990 [Luteolibacter sp.]